MSIKTVTLIPILILMAAIAQPLYACKCAGQRTVKEEIKQADAVLVGRIMSTVTQPKNSEVKAYRFFVTDVYKGKLTDKLVTIYSGYTSCDYTFEVGKRYIFYGYNDSLNSTEKESAFTTNLCTRI